MIENSKIRNARLAANLSQAQMAELLEIPLHTIENWEAGRRKPPIYVEKLVVEKLERIKYDKK